jgi:hypothetical protein
MSDDILSRLHKELEGATANSQSRFGGARFSSGPSGFDELLSLNLSHECSN